MGKEFINTSLFMVFVYVFVCIQISNMDQSLIIQTTDALLSCLKNSIKIYIKTAPTCSGVTVTPPSGRVNLM